MQDDHDSVTCKFCCEVFVNPVRLSCGHNICSSCIQTSAAFQALKDAAKSVHHIKSESDDSEENSFPAGDYFPCPSCGSIIRPGDGSGAVTPNDELKAAVEQFLAARLSVARCGICAMKDAVMDCLNCGCPQCDDCNERLHAAPGLKMHVRSDLGTLTRKVPRLCSRHQEPVRLYCQQCDSLICLLCSTYSDTHRGHSVMALPEYAELCKSHITSAAAHLANQSANMAAAKSAAQQATLHLAKVHEQFETDVREAFRSLRAALQQREAQLIDASNRLRNHQAANLRREGAARDTAAVYLREAAEFLKQSAAASDPFALASSAQTTKDLLTRLQAESMLERPFEQPALEIDLHLPPLIAAVAAFGRISRPSQSDEPNRRSPSRVSASGAEGNLHRLSGAAPPSPPMSSPQFDSSANSPALPSGLALEPTETLSVKPAAFHAAELIIGHWRAVSASLGDLVVKVYYAKKQFVWEVLVEGIKRKLEINFNDISGLATSFNTGADMQAVTVEVRKRPKFFVEVNPQPKKNTQWHPCADFTDGAATTFRRHTIKSTSDALSRSFKKLLEIDQRMRALAASGLATYTAPPNQLNALSSTLALPPPPPAPRAGDCASPHAAQAQHGQQQPSAVHVNGIPYGQAVSSMASATYQVASAAAARAQHPHSQFHQYASSPDRAPSSSAPPLAPFEPQVSVHHAAMPPSSDPASFGSASASGTAAQASSGLAEKDSGGASALLDLHAPPPPNQNGLPLPDHVSPHLLSMRGHESASADDSLQPASKRMRLDSAATSLPH